MLNPVIIIPDTTPLIHLAAGELLHLLPALGRVVVPDVVAMEATRLPEKPWAVEIATWFNAATIEVVETELGEIYRLAIEHGRRPPRNAGEISIMAWLRDNLVASTDEALVVFEDSLVPRLIALEAFGDRVAALTTRDFIEVAVRRGVISSAEDAFSLIQARVPTVSPASFSNPRKPAP